MPRFAYERSSSEVEETSGNSATVCEQELVELLESEQKSRWSIGIDERHGRFVIERDLSRALFEDHSVSSVQILQPQPSVTTVFHGDVLSPTVVKKIAPLASLEARLRELEMEETAAKKSNAEAAAPYFADSDAFGVLGAGAPATLQRNRRASIALHRHNLLPPAAYSRGHDDTGGKTASSACPSSSFPKASPPTAKLPETSFMFRILEKRESSVREDISKEEADDFRRLRSQCGRGMLSIIGAITSLPQEQRELAMLRLRDDERRAFMQRPTLQDEHRGRSVLVFQEREAFFRFVMLRNEDAMIKSIFGRFYSVKASITSFLRAQWLVRSMSSRHHELRNKYFTNWKHHASSTQRLRRIVLGLNRLRKESERNILHRYASKWNYPIQERYASFDIKELTVAESELREHMDSYEEECRARLCAEILESVLFGKIVDEHFAVIGPLIEARRSTAALELEMLNAARLSKLRLRTWYFWTVDRQNEAKVAYLREKAMLLVARSRFDVWYRWSERQYVAKGIVDAKHLLCVEMEEDVGRLVLESRLVGRHFCLITKATRGPRRCDVPKVMQRLGIIAKIATKTFQRKFFDRWLMFTSRNNIEARSLFLSYISEHLVRTRFYLQWWEFNSERRAQLQLAFMVESSDRSFLLNEEGEARGRFSIELQRTQGLIRMRRLALRVPRYSSEGMRNEMSHGGGISSLEDEIPPERVDEVGDDEPSLAGVTEAPNALLLSCSGHSGNGPNTGMSSCDEKDVNLVMLGSLPSALADLRMIPSPDGGAAPTAHSRMRFCVWRRYAQRKASRRRALGVVESHTFRLLVRPMWDLWAYYACIVGEERGRIALVNEENSVMMAMMRGFNQTLVESISDAKMRSALQLAYKNEVRGMAAPFARFMALVHRRRAARSKGPDVASMERRAQRLLAERYVRYWRKVVSRAKALASVGQLQKSNEVILMKRYWNKFPPSLIRMAKISRVRQELEAAKSAAAELDSSEGYERGSIVVNRLLRRRSNFTTM